MLVWGIRLTGQKEDERMALTREQVLEKIEERSKDTIELDVPEWGGAVRIRRLSSAEVAKFSEGDPKMPAQTVAACLVDENGNQLFESKDVHALAKADVETMTSVFLACLKYNGMDVESADEAMQAFGIAQPTSSSTD